MELLNTPHHTGTLSTLIQRRSCPPTTNCKHIGFAIPTWFRGLRLRGGRRWASCILRSALGEEAPPRREFHAQLLCHLHVVPGVDVVKDAASCQLHLDRERSGETGVTGFSMFDAAAQTHRFWDERKHTLGPQKQFWLQISIFSYFRILRRERVLSFFFLHMYLFSNCLAQFFPHTELFA